MNISQRKILLSSVSALAFSTFCAAPALATPSHTIYDTGAGTISHGTDTILSGTTATTGIAGEAAGHMTGNGSGTYRWNINGDMTASGVDGLLIDVSDGINTVDLNGADNSNSLTISSDSDAGINISATGAAAVEILLQNGASVTGSSSEPGIHVVSTGTGGLTLSIDDTSSVTNSSDGSAAIQIDSSTANSTISNAGAISGGAVSTGAGIILEEGALLDSLTNEVGGTISGSSTGSGVGIDISSNDGGNIGLDTLTNFGTISGGFSGGAGISIGTNGHIGTLTNASGGTIHAIGGNARGLLLNGFSTIDVLNNAGTIQGWGTNLNSGIELRAYSEITTLNNLSGGVILGGGSTGYGIDLNHFARISTINNLSGATISGAPGDASGYAISLSRYSTVINNGAKSGGVITDTGGDILGNIIMASSDEYEDTVNIYGGQIVGTIYGQGGSGVVNVDVGSGNIYDSSDTEYNYLRELNAVSGTLQLNGDDVIVATTTVHAGATIDNSAGSTFGYLGNIVNNGTFYLGHNTTNINGSFSGSGTLKLDVQAGAEGSHGLLDVDGGNVDLTGMRIDPNFTKGDVVAGSSYVIVRGAGDPVTVDNTVVQSRNGIKWSIALGGEGSDHQDYSYDENDVLITSHSLTEGVTGPNVAALIALSEYGGTNSDVLNLLSGLNSSTNYSQAAAQLGTGANGAGQQGAFDATGEALDTILEHLYANRTGKSSGEIPPGVGLWMQGFGAVADQSNSSGVDGFESSSMGATFGADRAIRDNLRLGAAFSYANTSVDEKGSRSGSGQDIDSYIGSVYGSYRASSPWYIDGIMTVAAHEHDSTRLAAGPVIGKGEYTAMQYGIKAEVGYPVAVQRFTLTPLASFAYDHLNQDGYTETGTGLSLGDSSTNSYVSGVGLRLATERTASNGWLVRPTMHAKWMHQFNDSLIPDQTASFTGGGASFTTAGLDLPQNSFNFGVGVHILTQNSMTLTAKYEGELRTNYMSNAGMLRARLDF